MTVEPTRLYRQIGVYSWGKGIIERDSAHGADLSKLTYFELPQNALVLSNIQAWEAAIARSTGNHAGFIASQRFLSYVPKTNESVDVDYVLNYLLSDHGMQQIREASPGTVTRNRTLGIKAFEAIELPLPKLAEQKMVASRLAMSRIAAQPRFVESAKGMREHLLANASSCSERLTVGDFAKPDTKPTRVDVTQQYHNVGLLNRGRGLFKKPPLDGGETKYKQLFQITKDQLIYSKLFGWEGAVSVVPPEYDGHFVSPEFPHFDLDTSVIRPTFMRHLARSDLFQSRLAVATTGMGQRRQRVNVSQFLAVEVHLPSIDQQDKLIPHLDRLERALCLDAQRRRLAAALPVATRNDIFAKFTR